MREILFATDLDNTLLFSHRYRRPGDICAEYLEGKEQGFLTPQVWAWLENLPENLRLLPVTTRSVAQYRRIQWPVPPEWAVAVNGGILLRNGELDGPWRADFTAIAAPFQPELARLAADLERWDWCLRRSLVDGLYLYAVCPGEEGMMDRAALYRGQTPLTVEPSGRKLYFLPPGLDKGAALERARRRFRPSLVISAGDSTLDLPMLQRADLALVPDASLALQVQGPEDRDCPKGRRFSEFVLETALESAR